MQQMTDEGTSFGSFLWPHDQLVKLDFEFHLLNFTAFSRHEREPY